MAAADASIAYESLGNVELHKVFLDFFENETYTDVEFKVTCGDDSVLFKAHRLPLSFFSPVFEDMFYGPAGSYDGEVIINDVTPQVFSVMLRFIYGSVCELNRLKRDVHFLLKLYKAAALYQIEALECICKNSLASMTPDKGNVFQLLDAAKMTEDEGIWLRCIHVLETRTAEVLANQRDLCDVSRAMMMTILNLKRVSFATEFELVMWVFAWAKNEHIEPGNTRSFRNILDDVLGHVDLTAMTAKEFGRLLANNPNVFSDSEGFKIFRNIVDPGCCHLPDWASATIDREYNYRG